MKLTRYRKSIRHSAREGKGKDVTRRSTIDVMTYSRPGCRRRWYRFLRRHRRRRGRFRDVDVTCFAWYQQQSDSQDVEDWSHVDRSEDWEKRSVVELCKGLERWMIREEKRSRIYSRDHLSLSFVGVLLLRNDSCRGEDNEAYRLVMILARPSSVPAETFVRLFVYLRLFLRLFLLVCSFVCSLWLSPATRCVQSELQVPRRTNTLIALGGELTWSVSRDRHSGDKKDSETRNRRIWTQWKPQLGATSPAHSEWSMDEWNGFASEHLSLISRSCLLPECLPMTCASCIILHIVHDVMARSEIWLRRRLRRHGESWSSSPRRSASLAESRKRERERRFDPVIDRVSRWLSVEHRSADQCFGRWWLDFVRHGYLLALSPVCAMLRKQSKDLSNSLSSHRQTKAPNQQSHVNIDTALGRRFSMDLFRSGPLWHTQTRWVAALPVSNSVSDRVHSSRCVVCDRYWGDFEDPEPTDVTLSISLHPSIRLAIHEHHRRTSTRRPRQRDAQMFPQDHSMDARGSSPVDTPRCSHLDKNHCEGGEHERKRERERERWSRL